MLLSLRLMIDRIALTAVSLTTNSCADSSIYCTSSSNRNVCKKPILFCAAVKYLLDFANCAHCDNLQWNKLNHKFALPLPPETLSASARAFLHICFRILNGLFLALLQLLNKHATAASCATAVHVHFSCSTRDASLQLSESAN